MYNCLIYTAENKISSKNENQVAPTVLSLFDPLILSPKESTDLCFSMTASKSLKSKCYAWLSKIVEYKFVAFRVDVKGFEEKNWLLLVHHILNRFLFGKDMTGMAEISFVGSKIYCSVSCFKEENNFLFCVDKSNGLIYQCKNFETGEPVLNEEKKTEVVCILESGEKKRLVCYLVNDLNFQLEYLNSKHHLEYVVVSIMAYYYHIFNPRLFEDYLHNNKLSVANYNEELITLKSASKISISAIFNLNEFFITVIAMLNCDTKLRPHFEDLHRCLIEELCVHDPDVTGHYVFKFFSQNGKFVWMQDNVGNDTAKKIGKIPKWMINMVDITMDVGLVLNSIDNNNVYSLEGLSNGIFNVPNINKIYTGTFEEVSNAMYKSFIMSGKRESIHNAEVINNVLKISSIEINNESANWTMGSGKVNAEAIAFEYGNNNFRLFVLIIFEDCDEWYTINGSNVPFIVVLDVKYNPITEKYVTKYCTFRCNISTVDGLSKNVAKMNLSDDDSYEEFDSEEEECVSKAHPQKKIK